MSYTYSHYEKVTIKIKRNWLQKLLRFPSEVSVWNRRTWTTDDLESSEIFSKVMTSKNQTSELISYISQPQLEQNTLKVTPYIKTENSYV